MLRRIIVDLADGEGRVGQPFRILGRKYSGARRDVGICERTTIADGKRHVLRRARTARQVWMIIIREYSGGPPMLRAEASATSG